ncbi:unnamed protein product [Albugo candida]|uniref:Uncharacterized protein n=1 Tax=Albugo candida TaxID=65357 RepID=A0A024GS74_9STRA|nr:unnamed protein product [Albugo candida]|eukprot:CCI49637.1 unnamed protein product [Albugo candida]
MDEFIYICIALFCSKLIECSIHKLCHFEKNKQLVHNSLRVLVVGVCESHVKPYVSNRNALLLPAVHLLEHIQSLFQRRFVQQNFLLAFLSMDSIRFYFLLFSVALVLQNHILLYC